MKMRILAIDPGSLAYGYAVSNSDERLETYGTQDLQKYSYNRRFSAMCEGLEIIWLAHWHDIDEIVIEKPVQFRGRKIPALEVAYRAALLWAHSRVGKRNVYSYHPATWRTGVAGASNASKEYIARIVCLHFPEIPAYTSDHATDAIAILLYHFAQVRVRAMIQGGIK